jgi:hypothetical protein
MLKCFSDLIGETIEAYVDDIVVKSRKADQFVADLKKTFKKLQENGIKLNPEKCIFRVPRGMLLSLSSLSAASKPIPRRTLPSLGWV